MARKGCFEVIKLKFIFYCSMDEMGKTELVSEGMRKYVKKYASNTDYKITHELKDIISPDVEIKVEFSKVISLNTVEKILSHIVGTKSFGLTYASSNKEVRISIM